MKKPTLPAFGLALVLALSGCGDIRTEDPTPKPGHGPLYKFVQMPNERWSFAGAFPGRGYPNNVPATKFDSLYITLADQDHEGLVLPAPPSEIIGWPQGEAKR